MISIRRLSLRERRVPGQLRVAIVAETFLPNVNGVTNSVLRLLEYLRANGHAAMVIAPGPGDSTHEGVPVTRVRAFDMPRYDSMRVGLPFVRMASIFRDFEPDIVHLAAPTVLGAAGVRAARRVGVPAVAVYQTDIVGFAKRHGLGVAGGALWRWLHWIHSQADLTLAPSTSAAWALGAHRINNVARWQRGVDLERFHPDRRSTMLHRQLAPSGNVLVGYVGRLAKEKQVERLVPISRLPGVQVVIVGDGPERARLERSMPLATFVGFQGGIELARYHATFDIFAHGGLDETFCQAVQEAFASGVAVVAPAAGGPLDLVAHGSNGYLWSPEQPETFVGAVSELAESPQLRKSMGLAGRASVEGRPWHVVMDDLIEHYRGVIDGVAPTIKKAA